MKKSKSLLEFVQESFEPKFPEIVENHINEGIELSETYLRLGSDSFNEIAEMYRRAYEAGVYEPTNEARYAPSLRSLRVHFLIL